MKSSKLAEKDRQAVEQREHADQQYQELCAEIEALMPKLVEEDGRP